MSFTQVQKDASVFAVLFIGFIIVIFSDLTPEDRWALLVVDLASMAGFGVYCGLRNLLDTAARRGGRRIRRY
jgi:hypothetical protein